VGQSALRLNTIGTNNTAIGKDAMYTNTTGNSNTVVGTAAMYYNTIGQQNVAVGVNALQTNTTGTGNTAVGYQALYTNTTGYDNIAIGTNALLYSNTGYRNVAIGVGCMQNNTSGGYNNTAVGYTALINNTNGYNNVAIGSGAMNGNTTGAVNTAIGTTAMYTNTTGYQNVAVGISAMYANTTGIQNTAIGLNTMYYNTIGTQNTAVGCGAMVYNQAGGNSDGFTNSSCLGNDSRVSGSDQVQCGNSSTSFYAYGAYNNRSDIRDKADVRDTVVGLEFINKVRAVDFRWNYRDDYFDEAEEEVVTEITDATGEVVRMTNKVRKLVPIPNNGSKKRSRFHQGVIAQQVKEAMDELGVDFAGYQDHTVNGGCDVLTIGYTEFVGPLIKAVQELSAQVTALQTEVSLLKSGPPTSQ
jgi:hypothetical protein